MLIYICRIAAFFSYWIDSRGSLSHHQTQPLEGNALNVTVLDNSRIIVSIDTVHEQNSTRMLRETERGTSGPLLSAFELVPKRLQIAWVPAMAHVMDAISEHDFDPMTAPDQGRNDSLSDALYAMENLRKRVQGDMEG